MSEACKTVCPECPFKRGAMKWLGAYKSPREFLNIHYVAALPNPCHMTVDYDADDWEDRAHEALQCRGQIILFKNSIKLLPDGWDISIEPDTETVFMWPHEFIEHHTIEEEPYAIEEEANGV